MRRKPYKPQREYSRMADFKLAGKILRRVPPRERDFFLEFMAANNKEKLQEKGLAVRNLECEIEANKLKCDKELRRLLDLMFDFKEPEITKMARGVLD